MGRLAERGEPFLGQRTTLQGAYPTVESAALRYVESDVDGDSKQRFHDFASSGRLSCANPRCVQGGYNLESQLDEMIQRNSESEEVSQSCSGHEGSPKGRRRGPGCLMSMTGSITVKYRKVTEKAPTDAQCPARA